MFGSGFNGSVLYKRKGEFVESNANSISISDFEPENLIYPYLSKRKATVFEEAINENNLKAVTGNLSKLYSKIDRLERTADPNHQMFVEGCKSMLGFEVSTNTTANGKQAGYLIDGENFVPMIDMGEGVSNILGLLVDLCKANERIFLIEEPENDIHPSALKKLMNLIVEKSETNQFFISTHSNIVVKNLGAHASTKLFHVTSSNNVEPDRPRLFVSNATEVGQESVQRRAVLEDLGYDLFDFDLWKGWLFLEESSAEELIRDWFIPWYTPSLQNKLRTFSANGVTNVEPKFEDFNRLFVFLHLEPAYKNRVWVLIDGGTEEANIVARMRTIYERSGWDRGRFDQFSKHDFEEYYPEVFRKQVQAVVSAPNSDQKRRLKADLLKQIKAWIRLDENAAKEAFSSSAAEVIEKLMAIDQILNQTN